MNYFDMLLAKNLAGQTDIDVEPLNASENGTYTAPSGKSYSPVNVSVPNTYTAQDEGKVVDNGALVAQTARTVMENGIYDTTLNNSFTVDVQKPTATITATPPIQFRSNGEPLVDWEIEGSSGGVGERTKNYANVETGTSVDGGVTFTFDHTTGTIIANGTESNRDAQCRIIFNDPNQPNTIIVPPGNYYYSATPTGGGNDTYNSYSWDYATNARSKMWDGQTSVVQDDGQGNCQVQINGHRQSIVMRIEQGYTANNVVFKPMLRAADTDAEFIPYGYEIPVTCGGKTTDIFIGDAPLTEGESITKAEANVDIPTLNGNNNLVVDTVAQPDSVTIQHYNYVAGIPYNTDGLCLYFPNDVGRVRLTLSTAEAPDVSKLNGMTNSLSEFDNTTVEIRFEMPENLTGQARLLETAGISLNLNNGVIEVSIHGVWHENFVTSFVGGEVYTISVTIGSGDLKLYVNGVLAETDTYTTFSLAGPIKTICNGGSIVMDDCWFPTTSTISKVRIYDRVLTAAEIEANYAIDNPT